jgi:hypothetical protein
MRCSLRMLCPALVAAALLGPAAAGAQIGLNPAAYSLAGAVGTTPRDIDAPPVNPALLGLPGRRIFSLRLLSASAHLDQNLLTLGRWNRFQGIFLGEEEKTELIQGVGKFGYFEGTVAVGGPGIQLGAFALGTQLWIDVEGRLPADLLELALRGNELDRTYHFGDLGVHASAVSAAYASLALGLPVPDLVFGPGLAVQALSLGIGVTYFQGHSWIEPMRGRADVHVTRDGLWGESEMVFRTAGLPGGLVDESSDDPLVAADTTLTPISGRGFGLDLGIAGVLEGGLSFHAALLNLSPGITWTEGTYEARLTASADTVSVGAFLELDQDGGSTDLDSLTAYDLEFRRIGAFRTRVPPVLRFGGTFRYGRLALNADLEQALAEGMGYSKTPRLGLGIEFRPLGFFPLRAGLSLGGRHGVLGAFGFGLDLRILVWEVAVGNTGLTPAGVRGLGVATGLKISL